MSRVLVTGTRSTIVATVEVVPVVATLLFEFVYRYNQIPIHSGRESGAGGITYIHIGS